MKSYVVIKSRNLDTLIYLLILTLAPGMEVYFCLKTNKCGYVKWNHTATVQQSSFFFFHFASKQQKTTRNVNDEENV